MFGVPVRRLTIKVEKQVYISCEQGKSILGKVVDVNPAQYVLVELGLNEPYEPKPWEDDDIKRLLFHGNKVCRAEPDSKGVFRGIGKWLPLPAAIIFY